MCASVCWYNTTWKNHMVADERVLTVAHNYTQQSNDWEENDTGWMYAKKPKRTHEHINNRKNDHVFLSLPPFHLFISIPLLIILCCLFGFFFSFYFFDVVLLLLSAPHPLVLLLLLFIWSVFFFRWKFVVAVVAHQISFYTMLMGMITVTDDNRSTAYNSKFAHWLSVFFSLVWLRLRIAQHICIHICLCSFIQTCSVSCIYNMYVYRIV